MRMEMAEVQWSDLSFESKLQTHQYFYKWVTKILFKFETSRMLANVGVKKALNLAHTILINRRHGDLEYPISKWSIESHTFVVA